MLAAALLLAQAPASGGVPLYLTATTANVSGAQEPVRIEILRWSSDEERDRLMAAWERRPAPGAGAPKAAKGGAKAGKGGAKGGGGGGGASAEPVSPEAALTAALQEAATVGYLWSSEAAGYALRYAGRVAGADGSQRIVLITQRRLGAMNQLWNPSSGTPNKHEFSVIELRLNARGEGEGKASLTGNVVADAAVRMVTLEGYDAAPVVFRGVKTAAKK